ncbi:MAG: hypothetical protein ABI182_01145 [Candidatus Baltobacteraceae bacterium]
MRFYRLAAAAAVLLGLAACGSGGAGGIGGILGGGALECNPGTQVQLANPGPNQSVGGGIGSIEIVANGNNNTLYSTYNQWNLQLISNLGDQVTSGSLNLTADPNGPHPYQSDFYYSASIQSLPSGRIWTVELNQTSNNCTPYPLQSFST